MRGTGNGQAGTLSASPHGLSSLLAGGPAHVLPAARRGDDLVLDFDDFQTHIADLQAGGAFGESLEVLEDQAVEGLGPIGRAAASPATC